MYIYLYYYYYYYYYVGAAFVSSAYVQQLQVVRPRYPDGLVLRCSPVVRVRELDVFSSDGSPYKNRKFVRRREYAAVATHENDIVMGRNRNKRTNHSVKLSTNVPMSQRSDYVDLCRNIIRDMDLYGVCVLDNFLGYERGMTVLNEVLNLYNMGVFKDGQLVRNKVSNNLKTIRGDQIIWVDGHEDCCKQIGQLISDVDAVVMGSNKMNDNGKLGNYTINGRTKAMVACYPGHGSHYVKHVDNPNKDGRCITAIYYLNKDWDIRENGGLLRIFPEGWSDQVADIEPLFDRILFFWSDRRNPHEVQPAFKTRYAITLWYFDGNEKEEAGRFQDASNINSMHVP